MTLEAVRADTMDLTPYGRLHDLRTDGVFTRAQDWQDRYTAEPVVGGPTHLGMTAGPALSVEVHLMEQHPHTREAIAPMTAPIVVPVAVEPRAHAVVALLLEPGQCLVLHPGIYHAPAMGLDGPSLYYWLAEVDYTVTDSWSEIVEGPLLIEVAHV